MSIFAAACRCRQPEQFQGSFFGLEGGTPTVKIDPASNAVAVSARPTQRLLGIGVIDLSVGLFPRYAPFEVAQFSKIRLVAENESNSDGPFIIFVSTVVNGGHNVAIDDLITLQPGQRVSRVYDVPGQTVFVNVGGDSPNRNGIVGLFGD